MKLEEILTVWLPQQRWFAGKGRAIRDLSIVTDTDLTAGNSASEPALRHLVIAVSQDSWVDRYQVLVGLRTALPDRLRHAMIGRVAGRGGETTVYDAAHDSELMTTVLRSIAAGRDDGRLRFRSSPGVRINTSLESLVLTGEQSNTSLVYGQEAILKLFRKVTPGINPDLEVTSALAGVGSAHIAQPFGWIEMDLNGTVTTLAILSEYLRTASDGWSLAQTSVRDLYAQDGIRPDEAGGDFAGEAHRLGAATADVHCDLAEAFGTNQLGSDAITVISGRMARKLDEPLRVQRIHGDYHLGQVVRTETRWVVLDFEGEPAAPLAQRRALSSPQRDRAAFCEGYAEASGSDPRMEKTVLRAFELEKAVYEVLYEARHRPSWLAIPLETLEAA